MTRTFDIHIIITKGQQSSLVVCSSWWDTSNENEVYHITILGNTVEKGMALFCVHACKPSKYKEEELVLGAYLNDWLVKATKKSNTLKSSQADYLLLKMIICFGSPYKWLPIVVNQVHPLIKMTTW